MTRNWTEAERLAVLHRTGLLDTPADPMFDDLVRLAAELLNMPIAAINLVDAERQWSKSEIGLGAREMPREMAFCPHAIHQPGGMIVRDATLDPRFASNPLVTDAPAIRFYAGIALEAEGLPIGALCVIDTVPHNEGLTEQQHFVLKTLAAQVNTQIALRGAIVRQRELLAQRLHAESLLSQERARVEHELRNMNATLESRIAARTAELARSEAQLRQSLKMEAVGQMTGGLAHDFNNLLTGIIGSLELASLRLADGRLKDLDHYLTAARGAAGRAATLTHRLLAFSRQQPLEPQPTNLVTLLGEFEELIQRTLGATIALEVVVEDAVWTALCDPNQLENAVLNLCINARDAMADGGRLVVSAANRSLDATLARELDLKPGQFVALSVIDTGTGMPPEVIAHAFDPFYTTKPPGQGTGLGLSMVYGFAQQSGGSVHIDSEAGQGTTVTIYLPRCPDETAAIPRVSSL